MSKLLLNTETGKERKEEGNSVAPRYFNVRSTGKEAANCGGE